MEKDIELRFRRKIEQLTVAEKVQLLNWLRLRQSDDPADRAEAQRQFDELRQEYEARHGKDGGSA